MPNQDACSREVEGERGSGIGPNSDGLRGGSGVTLTIICGLPGVGKTTTAREIAAENGARIIRSDVVRKQLFEEPSYSSLETEQVYEAVLDRARTTLPDPVVLDATFRRKRHRDKAITLAESAGVDHRIVKVECDENVVRRRISQRTDDESDADFSIYLQTEFEPLTRDATIVDNTPEQVEPPARA